MYLNKKIKNLTLLIFTALFSFIIPSFVSATENKEQNTSGELNNLVVLVSFLDDSSGVTGTFINKYHEIYNYTGVGSESVKNYFREASGGKYFYNNKGDLVYNNQGKLDYNAVFVSSSTTGVTAVKLDKKREYYMPEYYNGGDATNLPMAYDNCYYLNGERVEENTENAKKHIDGNIRENLMIREILDKLDTTKLDAEKLDNNKDGYIDNITFILAGNVVFNNNNTTQNIWGEMLWPHMTSLADMTSKSYFDNFYYDADKVKTEYGIDVDKPINLEQYGNKFIKEKRVFHYNVLSAGYMFNTEGLPYTSSDTPYTGVICHEMLHVLGLMDYYSYEKDKKDYQSVGKFEIMGSTKKNPQYSLSYLRHKLGWLDDSNFYKITENGSYTLYPVNSDNTIKAAVIKLSQYDTEEYFMIEARSDKQGSFDKDLGGTGLIIYRIDPAVAAQKTGNMYGDNDEIYVYRQFLKSDNGVPVYNNSADSGFLGATNLLGTTINEYGSPDEDALENTIFYQGTGNTFLAGENSRIFVNNIIINSDNSVTFTISLPEKREESETEPPNTNTPIYEATTEDFFSEGYPTFTKKSGGVNINLKTVVDTDIYVLILKDKENLTADDIFAFQANENVVCYEKISLKADTITTVSKDIEFVKFYIYVTGVSDSKYCSLIIKNLTNTNISCEANAKENSKYILIPTIIALTFIVKKRKKTI